MGEHECTATARGKGGNRGVKRGGADCDTGLPLPTRSPRDGRTKRIVEKEREGKREKERVREREAVGRERERVRRDHLVGVKCYRDRGRVGPELREVTPRIYEFTRTSEPVRESGRAGERASERDVFCYVNFLRHPVVETQERAR